MAFYVQFIGLWPSIASAAILFYSPNGIIFSFLQSDNQFAVYLVNKLMKKNLLFAFVLWLTSSMVQAQNPVAGWTLTTDSVQCLNHNVFFGDDTSVVNGNYNKTWYYGD